MVNFERFEIVAQSLQSLAWQDDFLVDLIGGGKRYYLNNKCIKPLFEWKFDIEYDSVIIHNHYAVLYEAIGLNAIIIDLKNNKIIRQLKRNSDEFQHYHYPIALFNLIDGREVIIHCPDHSESLEIELVDSGKRIIERNVHNQELQDLYHTRMMISRDSKYLVENAWVWHPMTLILEYNLEFPISFLKDILKKKGGKSQNWDDKRKSLLM